MNGGRKTRGVERRRDRRPCQCLRRDLMTKRTVGLKTNMWVRLTKQRVKPRYALWLLGLLSQLATPCQSGLNAASVFNESFADPGEVSNNWGNYGSLFSVSGGQGCLYPATGPV